jgi:hypothetical protein
MIVVRSNLGQIFLVSTSFVAVAVDVDVDVDVDAVVVVVAGGHFIPTDVAGHM